MNIQQYLALGSTCGLKVLRGDNTTVLKISGIDIDCKSLLFTERNTTTYGSFSKSKPICFPLSSLSKKIQIKDYNDGKPFVPIVELSTLFHLQMYQFINGAFYDNNYGKYLEYLQEMPFNVVQTLLSWHFAIGLSESEFIPVTDEFNPYK